MGLCLKEEKTYIKSRFLLQKVVGTGGGYRHERLYTQEKGGGCDHRKKLLPEEEVLMKERDCYS